MENTIRISKKKIYLFAVLLVLAVFLIGYFFYYMPKQEKAEDVNVYKKYLYESILCQYSCPFVNVTVLNETNYLPDVSCAQDCVETLKAKNVSEADYSAEELLNDAMVSDVDRIIQECKGLYYDAATQNTNHTALFECIKPKLENLKDFYDYLD